MKTKKPIAILLLVGLILTFCFSETVKATLTDNGDGTVTDGRGLMWLKAPKAGPGMTYDAAKAWADSLVFAGYDDWRLPSANDFDTHLPDTAWDSTNNEWGYLYGVEWGNPWGKAGGYPLPPGMATMPGYWDYAMYWWTATEADSSNAYWFVATWDDLWFVESGAKTALLAVTAVRDAGAHALVHLESRQDSGATSDLGTITFAGVTYSLPKDVSKSAGSYQAKYVASSSTYSFNYWEISGAISVSNKYANPATVTVSGAGTLRAIYRTTVFSDGFESGSFSAWTGKSVSAGETAAIVTTLKHHGTYSAKFTSNGTGGTEYAYCYKTISSSSELYARAYFCVSQSGIVDENDRFYFMILSASSDVAYAGWRKTGGVVKWMLAVKNGTTTEFAYSAGSPSLNQWYCVELHWKKSSTAGLGELFVNGVRVCSLKGKNTAAYGSVSKVRFGLSGIYYCASTTAYCDCVKVARTYVGPEFIFSDGFESGSFSSWTGKSNSAGETAAVTSSIAHHGNHSAKFTSNGNGGFEWASCYKSVSSLSEVYARGYFRVATSGIVDNGDSISFIAFANASGNYAAYAGWGKTGGVVRWCLVLGSTIVYSTATPSLNTWYCVELHWKKGTTNGLGELYVNGVKVCSITGKNTAAYGSVSQAIFGLAVLNCASATAYCDCAKIAANYTGPEY